MGSLSDKMRSECHGDNRCYCDGGEVIEVEDVKQFIKELKEELFGDGRILTDNEMIDIIDELAGKGLV